MELVDDPQAFLHSLRGLHDVNIERIEFDVEEKTLALTVDDLNFNFEGLPEYEGERPCTLVFTNKTKFIVDVVTIEGVKISHAEVQFIGARPQLEIDLYLGGGEESRGRRSIVALFDLLRIVDIRK